MNLKRLVPIATLKTDDIFGDGTSPGGVPSLGVLNMDWRYVSATRGGKKLGPRRQANGGQGIFNISGGTMKHHQSHDWTVRRWARCYGHRQRSCPAP